MFRTLALALLPALAAALTPALTSETWDTMVPAAHLSLVAFLHPRADTDIVPVLTGAAALLREADPPVLVATVDCSTEDAVCAAQLGGEAQLPALRLYRHGKGAKYQGPRTDGALVADFLQRMAEHGFTVLKNAVSVRSAVKHAKMESTSLMLAHFAGEHVDGPLYDVFATVANRHTDDFYFAVVKNATVLEEVGLTEISSPAIWIYSPFGDPLVRMPIEDPAAVSADDVESFLLLHGPPLVQHLSMGNTAEYLAQELPLLVAYAPLRQMEEGRDRIDYYRDALRNVAFEGRGKMICVVSDVTWLRQQLPRATIHGDEGVAIVEPATLVHYDFPGAGFPIDTPALERWVEKYFYGQLEAHVRSARAPAESDNTGPVRVVVRSTLDSEFFDHQLNVLLSLCLPNWDTDCGRFSAKLNQAAAIISRRLPNTKVIKMDVYENDVPNWAQSDTYPALFWSPKGPESGQAVLVDAELETDAIVRFVRAKLGMAQDGRHDEL